MLAGDVNEISELGISRSVLFYVVGFALGFELVIIGLLGMVA